MPTAIAETRTDNKTGRRSGTLPFFVYIFNSKKTRIYKWAFVAQATEDNKIRFSLFKYKDIRNVTNNVVCLVVQICFVDISPQLGNLTTMSIFLVGIL